MIVLKQDSKKNIHDVGYRNVWQIIHIDGILLLLLILLSCLGLIILFSASNQKPHAIHVQMMRFAISFGIMFAVAQISPATMQRFSPLLYIVAITMLAIVLGVGHVGKGAQRWFTLGFLRFQPSELMKLAIPTFLAWYYHHTQLPITIKSLVIALAIILVPAFLTAKQPDLGTAILLIIAGTGVLFLAGLNVKLIFSAISLVVVCIPFGWFFMHEYQRQRVLTFLNPERDPLGAGYHIIQSKIAIGSGGLFGKGWLNGTQSNLHFLPEHSTDFIFAVCGEEFGFAGSVLLLSLYVLIVIRGFYITINAQDTFSRLVAGSITISFFVSFFINMSMVTGILPVVGIPLPLVSYGGSSMVTTMISFGILMSIKTHRKLVTT